MHKYAVRLVKEIEFIAWLEADEPLTNDDVLDEVNNILSSRLRDEEILLKDTLNTIVISIHETEEPDEREV